MTVASEHGDAREAVTLPLDAVLFDMDGTLVDSTAVVELQWRRWAARNALDPEQILALSHGRRTLETIAIVAPHLATAEEVAQFEAEELAMGDGIRAVPGAADLIASLPRDAWAVVTSATQELARSRIATAGLPMPSVLIGAEHVSRGKPHPEGYLRAAELLGVDASRCVAIEDTIPGLESARASGCSTIAIATTYACSELGSRICIPDLRWLRVVEADGGRAISVRAADQE